MNNNFNLPESYAEENIPYIIPLSIKKLGVIADPHCPYHSISAVDSALNHLIKSNIDGLLINGDFMDFGKVCKYDIDPRKRDVSQELETGRQMLDCIQAALPGVKIYFKMGNHDIRLERWLWRKAPELLGMREFRLDILLGLGERHIEFITDKRIVKAGGLTVFHGHEVNLKSIVVSPAKSLYDKTKVSALCSHSHRPSFHSDKNVAGHYIGCWSTGHLGEEHPDYDTYNKWQHGFAEIELNGKEFEVSNYKIIKNKVYRT